MNKIEVSQVGKAYKQYAGVWSRLIDIFLPLKFQRHKTNWVLKDISFNVEPGEALGIIGLNGAGKSTLLKLITGTIQPTMGSIKINGRVAALLELGMGFHPQFTGRQNIFMAAQLLGMSNKEISESLSDIVSFAEIGQYIDQPIRVYSSGMQMRLAFSVATAIRPDILIVDEALSVGDAYFQHKCFERIKDFRKSGTTLLLVSHDKQAIQAICDRAILLEKGYIAMVGSPESVMDYYNAMLANDRGQSISQIKQIDGTMQTASGNGKIKLNKIKLLNSNKCVSDYYAVGEEVSLEIEAIANVDIKDLTIGYLIKDRLGQMVYGTNTTHIKINPIRLVSGESLNVKFDFILNFGEGVYSITVAFHTGESHIKDNFEWRDRSLMFEIVNSNKNKFVGVAWTQAKFERIQ